MNTSSAEYPLVSFVLLGYNQADFIGEAIEAAFAQDYPNLEIILSDDCSGDRTFDVMQELSAAYTGPHAIILNHNEKNMGIGPHVEHAVSMSNGTYVVMAGGDDISLPVRVSASVDVIRMHGELGGVLGRYHEFCGEFVDHGRWEPLRAEDVEIISGESDAWFDQASKGKLVGISGSVAMWNRKLFDLFSSLPSGTLAEDLILGNRALISGLGLGLTPAKMVHYRIHDANVYSGVKKEVFERRIFFSRAVVQRDFMEFRKRHPERYAEERWKKISDYIEAMLFRSIVIIRRPLIGRLLSRLLFLIGFK